MDATGLLQMYEVMFADHLRVHARVCVCVFKTHLAWDDIDPTLDRRQVIWTPVRFKYADIYSATKDNVQ